MQGGHAGIYLCTDENCNIWALADNGSPHASRGGYQDKDTKPVRFNAGSFEKGPPDFFRPVSALTPEP